MEFQGAVNITEIQGRGRSLVTSQPLRAGQIVLKDSPLILYSASPLIKSSSSSPEEQKGCYCSHCFKSIIINRSFIPCPSCSNSTDDYSVLFCSPNCHSLASRSSHTPWVCQALIRLRERFSSSNLQPEWQVQARFLVAAYNLAVISAANFMILLTLQSSSPYLKQDDSDSAPFLHSLISDVCPPMIPASAEFSFSLDLTAVLLSKDKLNAFGLMEPFAEEKERSVRAYGIYPHASFFNHDCLPNACRFDYVDADGGEMNNTDIIVRTIHDLPQGREVCLSYFPVNLRYSERQTRLKDDYGFLCCCDRCKVEQNWEEEEEENGEEEDEGEDMDEDVDEVMDESGDDKNDFPHEYFFLRYMCSRKNCGGTLAPVAPSSSEPSTLMECNVCGKLKSEDDDDGDEGSMDDGDDN